MSHCYTLEGAEITMKKPPRTKVALLQWDRIGTRMQGALLKDGAVSRARERRDKDCRGGEVTPACERAASALGEAVTEFVRASGELPMPEKVP